jgi:hypothetical protein
VGKVISIFSCTKLPFIQSPFSNSSNRYVSRVSINGKEVTGINNLPGVANLPLRYQSNNWKNSSGASSGASTGVSPIHSSNEDHNGEERFVNENIFNYVSS